MIERVAVVGLGRMGAAMAGRLISRGFAVQGYDIEPEAALRVPGLAAVTDVADVWRGVDAALLSLPLPEHVEAVLASLGDVEPGPLTVIDTSTSDPDVTQRLAARLDERGHRLIDAPVSGGPSAAAKGTLAMMLGGDARTIATVRPVLEALGDKLSHVGGTGAGHTAKLVNNVLCAAHILIAGEALRLGARAGTATAALADAVNEASGRSGVTEVNVPRWILSGSFDSGFTMALMEKDLSLAQRLAARSGLDLPLIETVVARWQACREAHGSSADFNRAFFGDLP